MKTIFKYLSSIILLIFLSCGSSSNYSKKTFDGSLFNGKTITFLVNNKSVNKIIVRGPRIGSIHQPNVRTAFKESISELANETNLNLKFIYSESQIIDSETLVEVVIINAVWQFGFSVAEMKTTINYKIVSNGKVYLINGIRKSGGGSEENNLKKSFKNANYNFLKEFEKQ